jgi:hypothetical protein
MEFGLGEFGMRLKQAIPIPCSLEVQPVVAVMKW